MKQETGNLIANYAGRGWVMAVNLIATPLLIKILGIESYGLIGFYTTLYGLINLLDFGISPTINRELAQYSVDENRKNKGRDLVRTLETGYWAIGIILGIIVFLGANFFAEEWLQSAELSTETLVRSIRLMGVLIVLEWPITFYQGCLLGLQKHVRLNIINMANSLLKFGGAILILKFHSPQIDTFFTWQIGVSTLMIGFLVWSVWTNLPQKTGRPAFDIQLLKNIWKFALSLNIIGFLGLVISQVDQVFISHSYSLDIFGYYNIALMINSGLTMVISPINLTYFPRFSALVAQNENEVFNRTFHQACQLISAAVFPVATVAILFSGTIIQIWTGDPLIAEKSGLVTSILLAGTALSALNAIPYQAQISHGWSRLALYTNLFSVPLVIGLVFLLNSVFGINGVASVRFVYALIGLLVVILIMFKHILVREMRTWIVQDHLPPILICLCFSGFKIISDQINPLIMNNVAALLIFSAVIQLATILSVAYTREKLILFINHIWRKYART